jgi:predicted Rossmann fold flavoprotein
VPYFWLVSKTIAIIGGGAAGYFAAIRVAELHPDYKIVILEKSNKTLAKVKVSGGGRCNVTNATFEPKQLVKNYPRGEKELLGPFHKFQPGDVFDWFGQRGIALKTEDDMRVFPESNTSQTIIDCFESEAKRLGVRIALQQGLMALHREESGVWSLELSDNRRMAADAVIIASGSSPAMWKVLETLGHSIVEPVPSLFTFNIKDPRIAGLQGLAGQQCEVYIQGTKHMSIGPVLVTHWGLSGPGILRLSAWAARELHQVNYDFIIRVNWDARFDRVSACIPH